MRFSAQARRLGPRARPGVDLMGRYDCRLIHHCRQAESGFRWTDYVLIAIVKRELQLDASLYTCVQVLSVSVFEKN